MTPLAELVPHRAPMLLLDRLTAHDDDSATCEVVIRADSMFFKGDATAGFVPAVVGLEYMAQCVGAYAGLAARAAGGQPSIGFLIGCRELLLEVDGFRVGETLSVRATRVWGETSVGSFTCEVIREGRVVVKGLLTVYQGPLPSDDPGAATS